jgi:hypothetical protein
VVVAVVREVLVCRRLRAFLWVAAWHSAQKTSSHSSHRTDALASSQLSHTGADATGAAAAARTVPDQELSPLVLVAAGAARWESPPPLPADPGPTWVRKLLLPLAPPRRCEAGAVPDVVRRMLPVRRS